MLLAKLILSPWQSKWLRRRVLCDAETACDWARMSQSLRLLSMQIHICLRGERASMHPCIHASCKSAGSLQVPCIDMPPLRMQISRIVCDGGYLDVKVRVFQIQRHEPVPGHICGRICFKVIILNDLFIRA